MEEVIIKGTFVQFKNPVTGDTTRQIRDHYYGRRVVYLMGGKERSIKLSSSEVGYDAIEDDIVSAVKNKLISEYDILGILSLDIEDIGKELEDEQEFVLKAIKEEEKKNGNRSEVLDLIDGLLK